MKRWKWFLLVFALTAYALLVSGCAAMSTALRYKDLSVQARLAETVFRKPIPASQKIVWIELGDTSGMDVKLSDLAGLMNAKGYKVVSDPEEANIWLQSNVRYLGDASTPAIQEAMHASYGGPILGAGAGAIIGGLASNSPNAPFVGGFIGGAIGQAAEWIAGELVKKVVYAVIVDIQISEKTGRSVTERQTARIQQGTGSSVQQDTGAYDSDRLIYRNRLSATATQVNLDFETAKPALIRRITESIAGMLN
ncbi:hypothetical protein A2661_02780 [Candidatus Giovannonibacteria bacterium RIFCSPHIGHO2_01_FULL_45_24]|uniref:Conjugal transfer protein TraT n=1 Tax=Candidatus Giovannonibacteria bacterium RIFCSPLOWO2_01_FULL_46_32 TaxID=1798353 RepID=A0A1F5XGF2_9BACT|nr:MAG: hypothetical protein A2661_02780 [Candidatus Giovannonibacteria bacterium RIFCSPHIGHO2_01_FULL_45_24]OGF86940.1 MAG: hypothetical protein A3B19_00700 [Candidatus Giovannonibacteria bacterium RIFCSPLOWO2_01_FULL_46_32]